MEASALLDLGNKADTTVLTDPQWEATHKKIVWLVLEANSGEDGGCDWRD